MQCKGPSSKSSAVSLFQLEFKRQAIELGPAKAIKNTLQIPRIAVAMKNTWIPQILTDHLPDDGNDQKMNTFVKLVSLIVVLHLKRYEKSLH